MLLGGAQPRSRPDLSPRPRGIGCVPQEREIFPSLTVRENLTIGARPGHWTPERVFELFPNLRRAALEHGQPALRRRAADALDRARASDQSIGAAHGRADRRAGAGDRRKRSPAVLLRLRGEGALSIVLVEQNSRVALAFSSRTVVMDKGPHRLRRRIGRAQHRSRTARRAHRRQAQGLVAGMRRRSHRRRDAGTGLSPEAPAVMKRWLRGTAVALPGRRRRPVRRSTPGSIPPRPRPVPALGRFVSARASALAHRNVGPPMASSPRPKSSASWCRDLLKEELLSAKRGDAARRGATRSFAGGWRRSSSSCFGTPQSWWNRPRPAAQSLRCRARRLSDRAARVVHADLLQSRTP